MELLRLKDILKEKEITGGELSERVGVSSQTISNIITNRNFPKPDLLHRIASELDIDIRELFYSTKNSDLNGFVEYRGEMFKIKSLEDLERLNEKVKN